MLAPRRSRRGEPPGNPLFMTGPPHQRPNVPVGRYPAFPGLSRWDSNDLCFPCGPPLPLGQPKCYEGATIRLVHGWGCGVVPLVGCGGPPRIAAQPLAIAGESLVLSILTGSPLPGDPALSDQIRRSELTVCEWALTGTSGWYGAPAYPCSPIEDPVHNYRDPWGHLLGLSEGYESWPPGALLPPGNDETMGALIYSPGRGR